MLVVLARRRRRRSRCRPAQVSFDRILHGDREPQNWLSYSGTPLNQRYSGLTQITPANVKNLQLQWMWQARSLEKFEATPLVVDGVMYTVEAPNNIVALDAATGRPFWTFNYTPAPEGRPCCGRVNRGVAILGDTLYMATIDAHLIAVDAKSGQPLWNIVVAEGGGPVLDDGISPLIVKDKVIVGTGGGDGPIRGFIAAYDAKTGKEAVALLHDPRCGRTGQRDVGRRLVEDRRRRRVERGRLRPGDQPGVLRHRQPGARLGRIERGSATTSIATASSRSTPTPAN